MQTINVTEGLESTLVMFGHKLRRGIKVERDFDPELPRIEAIPGELNQVWTNLIANALDAMGGTGTLRLTTRVDDLGWVVVEVADTGPGMPENLQARAFEPFFTTKDVGVGTGLGLDISRRIVVDRHSGEITHRLGPRQDGPRRSGCRLGVRNGRDQPAVTVPERLRGRPGQKRSPPTPLTIGRSTLLLAGFTVSRVPGSGRTVYCWSVETTTSPIRCPAGNT